MSGKQSPWLVFAHQHFDLNLRLERSERSVKCALETNASLPVFVGLPILYFDRMRHTDHPRRRSRSDADRVVSSESEGRSASCVDEFDVFVSTGIQYSIRYGLVFPLWVEVNDLIRKQGKSEATAMRIQM